MVVLGESIIFDRLLLVMEHTLHPEETHMLNMDWNLMAQAGRPACQSSGFQASRLRRDKPGRTGHEF